MPRKDCKGNGKILNFRGVITEEERKFLIYCTKVASLTKDDTRRLFRIKAKTEKLQNKGLHIVSVIEKIERIFFDD